MAPGIDATAPRTLRAGFIWKRSPLAARSAAASGEWREWRPTPSSRARTDQNGPRVASNASRAGQRTGRRNDALARGGVDETVIPVDRCGAEPNAYPARSLQYSIGCWHYANGIPFDRQQNHVFVPSRDLQCCKKEWRSGPVAIGAVLPIHQKLNDRIRLHDRIRDGIGSRSGSGCPAMKSVVLGAD